MRWEDTPASKTKYGDVIAEALHEFEIIDAQFSRAWNGGDRYTVLARLPQKQEYEFVFLQFAICDCCMHPKQSIIDIVNAGMTRLYTEQDALNFVFRRVNTRRLIKQGKPP